MTPSQSILSTGYFIFLFTSVAFRAVSPPNDTPMAPLPHPSVGERDDAQVSPTRQIDFLSCRSGRVDHLIRYRPCSGLPALEHSFYLSPYRMSFAPGEKSGPGGRGGSGRLFQQRVLLERFNQRECSRLLRSTPVTYFLPPPAPPPVVVLPLSPRHAKGRDYGEGVAVQ